MSKFPDGKSTTVKLINGEAATMLATLDAGSIQCCVTSPPYYGLRDYDDPDQLGLEKTPNEYVARLVDVFREVRRVLRDDGTVWLNLGDSYNAYNGNRGPSASFQAATEEALPTLPSGYGLTVKGLKPKDLIGIPWRVAFALQADGWILRSDIIWEKPNPMPESVDDRPTKAHEYLFLLAKQGRYYYDAGAISEPSVRAGESRTTTAQGFGQQALGLGIVPTGNAVVGSVVIVKPTRNRRDVWTIAAKPFPGAHFAVMPPALVEPCILAGTSERGCCPACGAPWGRMTKKTKYRPEVVADGTRDVDKSRGDRDRKLDGRVYNAQAKSITVGWSPSCSCPAHEPVPCTVIDPYCGSGTVGAVAVAHDRAFVGIDLKTEYLDMARNRIADAQRGNLYRPRTGSKADGSMPLFGE